MFWQALIGYSGVTLNIGRWIPPQRNNLCGALPP